MAVWRPTPSRFHFEDSCGPWGAPSSPRSGPLSPGGLPATAVTPLSVLVCLGLTLADGSPHSGFTVGARGSYWGRGPLSPSLSPAPPPLLVPLPTGPFLAATTH